LIKPIATSLIVLGIIFLITKLIFLVTLTIPFQKECDQWAKIAKNPNSIAYVDSWVTSHILNRGYYSIRGTKRVAAFSEEGQLDITPGLDWNRIGVNELHGQLRIEKRSESKHKDPISKANISRITIRSGRNEIFILKNGATLSEHRGVAVDSQKFLKVNDTVYAYCGD
jgi:hypothetical protein